MKDNKPLYEKIYIWIGIIAGIFGILGISIFGGKPIFRNNQADTPSQTKDYEDEKTSSRYYSEIIHDQSWESEYFGLRYTAPRGMSMYTEEELDLENLSMDSGQNGSGRSVNEMISISDDQYTEVIVWSYDSMSKEEFFQSVELLKSKIGQDSSINIIQFGDNETVKICNDDYVKVSFIEECNNVFAHVDLYLRVVGDRIIMIMIIFDDERARDNVLDAFTAY